MDLPELKVHAAQMANIPMQLGSGVLDRLRGLDVQGRALQALQLLKDNDYGADVPEDYVERLEHVNVTIEDMLKYLDEARQSSNDEGTDWTVVGGDEGMHLRFRYDWNTGRVEIVGDVLLQIDPIHAWAFMREFDLVPLWTRAEKSTLEATFGPESELYCVESPAASWMLSPTEAYSERTYIDALDEHGMLICLVESPPLDANACRGFSIPPAPSGKRRIGSYAREGLTPVSSTEALLTFYRRIDTHFPCLPSWLISTLAGSLVGSQVARMHDAIAGWEGSEHQARLQSSARAAYYAELRPRAAAIIASGQGQRALAKTGLAVK
jgi:hypothetical protein